MKFFARILAASGIIHFAAGALATTITNNFNLTPADTSFDGGDLVISNCTVKMDGAHSFNSLLVGAGGVLTHTIAASGSTTFSGAVTNEPIVLTGTNLSTLFYSYVSGNVSLMDTNQNIFINGTDFIQTTLGNQTQIARLASSAIPDGATAIATYTWNIALNTGLNVYLTNDLNVATGGSINVNGAGYGGNTGTGHGNTASGASPDGSGGGHGGSGGMSISNALGGACNDLYYQPTLLGSGGGTSYAGSGGFGGGKIQITAGGNVNIDGLISANGAPGTNSRAGGGAGGSLWITAGNIFSGAGSLLANGGAGEPVRGGGGGGGRISIQFGTNIFSGGINACGATGGKNGGGAGTVYLRTNNQTATLVLDNGGLAGTNSVVGLIATTDVIVRNGAWLTPNNANFNPRKLTIGTNGLLAMTSSSTTLNLTTSGDCVIQSGGTLGADLLGYGPNTGTSGSAGGSYPGTSGIYYCGGGGHGGYGGSAGPASTYGAGGIANDFQGGPTLLGSGGGGIISPSIGGAGGGALQLNITGTLQVDGKISANGGNGSGTGGGGGAGGGIYIANCTTLAGSGSIIANGGNGIASFGGGGGGGRIAALFNNNNFSGTFLAAGGSGASYGGAGTIFLKTNSLGNGQIIVDNAGHPGAFTTWTSSSSDLILRNGAICSVPSSASFGSLTIGTNAMLLATNSAPGQIILTATAITVQSGGLISSDFGGYAGGSGISSGAGTSVGATSPYYACSGAGHGGYGGASIYIDVGSSYSGGGNYYDTASSPSFPGSGGGNYSSFSFGGKGGGAIKLSVSGNVQLDGSISANAASGTGLGGGGGSGGSVNIACATFAGTGSLTANGGTGASNVGGGGAGGMIYASFNSNNFSGTLAAFGGGGFHNAGAGTIFLQTNSGQSLLIVDNGGRRGTNTPVSSYNNNWIIRNGAVAQPNGSSFTINSLVIGSNSTLLPYISNGSINSTIYGNVTIQPGGGIFADGYGSAQNNGTGRGNYYAVSPYYQSGGGGHGGYGGNGATNFGTGGSTYDSSSSPAQVGSGGGNYSSAYGIGGSGGGFVRLNIYGNLQNDGSITANGANGSGIGAGGGAGGGIYLNVQNGNSTFKGSGSITANGGNGALFGGGGGGGRIAILYYSNFVAHSTFNGSVTAFGGSGANYGGAGTIYTQNYLQQLPQLILDNGGNAGTNTTFDFSYTDVTVQNKAVGVLQSSGSWSLDNLLIRTNSALVAPNSNSRTISANNLTIDAGGALLLDGAGSASSSGSGFAQYGLTVRGGGGHGGFGGGNGLNFGRAYDSIQSPNIAGSGGGGWSSGNGGSGGGVLTANINGTLTVNGRLSANGLNGDFGAGGGSGGSLNLQNINRLAGGGVISANGGAGGSGLSGGGGGGRIAIIANTSTFSGQMVATGGGGTYPGGAGTIFTRLAGQQTLTVDNGNLAGTNTPFGSLYSPPTTPFDLNITGQSVVAATPPLPLLNNFNLAAGSTFIVPAAQTSLFLAVRTNVNIFGSFTVDNLGFSQGSGGGFGNNLNSSGAGGGYGGAGGNAATGATGGNTNGSATQPQSFGSGGGFGSGTVVGGSEGGGALRLTIGGNLNVTGNFSANGDYGWQDNSGGGSGGSLWIAANSLTGLGNISASGGNGDLWNGGGGGGGRIAIYSPTNLFSGTTNVNGGMGAMNGQAGTIFLSSSFLDFFTTTMSPTGAINNTVGYVDLTFSDAVDPASVATSAFTLTTPTGILDPSNFTAAATSATSVRLNFPVQNVPGTYTFTAAAPLASILGQPLAQTFSGTFTMTLPTVSGTVADTNGAPIPGVLVQPDGGLTGATTDANGFYSIGVPPGWNGGLTPALGQLFFVPGTLTLANVTASLTNQNFIMYPNLSPTLASSFDGTNVTLAWQSINGVSYSIYDSADLVNWTAYTGAGYFFASPNNLMQFIAPMDFTAPQLFYRLNVSH